MRFYDWRLVLTTLNGVPVTDWAEGDDVFKAERLKEAGELVIGADGNGTLSLSADKSCKVTIKLAKTSPLNAVLSGLSNSEDYMETFVPVLMGQLDTYRLDSVGTTLGFIQKHADMQGGSKGTPIEWVMIFPEGHFIMGDPPFAGTPSSLAEALG